MKALFDIKTTAIIVAAFKRFAEFGRDDKEFGRFLDWFVNGGNETRIDGKVWEDWNLKRSTTDISIVHGKLDYLTALMEQYFQEIRKAA